MSNLLVIAESEAIRSALDLLLSRCGHRVLTTVGPEDGLWAVATTRIDLVLLTVDYADEDEPGETSLALMRSLRSCRPSLPLVVLVDRGSHLLPELVPAETVEQIIMPWTNDHLMRTIEALLVRRAVNAPRRAGPGDSKIRRVPQLH